MRGIPVTTIERTCVDDALRTWEPCSLVTLDAALRRCADRHVVEAILARQGSARRVVRARRAVAWADPYAETPLESRGRGELLIRGVPAPECNLTFRFQGEEFRPDAYWRGRGLIGEADGSVKYGTRDGRSLWEEKLRQHWFESELGLSVFRWVFGEMRHQPERAAQRWWQMATAAKAHLWAPPDGLEIIRRPLWRP